MRFPVLFVAAFAALIGPAGAHDLFMDLGDWSAPGNAAEIDARFRIGHAADSLDWKPAGQRSFTLTVVGPEGREDRSAAFIRGKDGTFAALRIEGEGAHVIALESDAALQILPAEKYNAFIEEEGLALAIEARRAAGRRSSPGRELYSRAAKALVRIGGCPGAQAPAPIGLALEIVPLGDPCALADSGEPLRLMAIYQGAPLAGARVGLESLDVGLVPELFAETDASGVAEFRVPHRGAWKAAVVWSRPRGPGAEEFETVFSSLTFAFD